MKKERDADGELLVGNARYYGYCIDMLESISKHVGFQYEIVEVDDNNYGSPMEDGSWNGMVGKLMTRVRVFKIIIKDAMSDFWPI